MTTNDFDYLGSEGKLECSGFTFSLKSDGWLGKQGESIMCPRDRVILPSIFRYGLYGPELISFFRDHIDKNTGYLLLDIGANIGLFARQMINLFPSIESVACVEPDPTNYSALRFNMTRPHSHPRIRLQNAALGPDDGMMTLYRDLSNIGNYSLNKSAMPRRPGALYDEAQVPVVSVAKWMEENASVSDTILWKSDTQGYDELIISEVPWPLWRRVDVAIAELFRIDKPNFSMSEFKAKIDDFPHRSVDRKTEVSSSFVIDYLQSNDMGYCDLYMWR
jgi:FkbM family methyltransferase